MGDTWMEFAALLEEFMTSVFQLPAFVGIVVMIVVFVLEVRWERAHPPVSRRVEKAVALGHVVNAKRIKYWDDGLTAAEKTTSWYHAAYVYGVSGKQYEYKYMEREFPPMTIKLYYIHEPRKTFRAQSKRGALSRLLFLLLPIAAGVAVMGLLGGV